MLIPWELRCFIMVGHIKIKMFCLVTVFFLFLNAHPRTGMSPNTGTFLLTSVTLVLTNPPSAKT